jgi:hypothetical protein
VVFNQLHPWADVLLLALLFLEYLCSNLLIAGEEMPVRGAEDRDGGLEDLPSCLREPWRGLAATPQSKGGFRPSIATVL